MSCQPSLPHNGHSATALSKSVTASPNRPGGVSFSSNATGLSGDQFKFQYRQTETARIGSRRESPAHPAENGRAGWWNDDADFEAVRAGRYRTFRNRPAIEVEAQID